MRILLSLVAGALMTSTGAISLADHSDATLRTESQTPAVKAAARKAWPAFFAQFRAAVNKRDRNELMKMMAKDFNGPPHTRDEAFKQWDDPKFGGWAKLSRALSQGAILAGAPDEGDPDLQRPTMIAPPVAETSKRYHGWWAAFTFEEDGKWYCIQFLRF